MTATLNASTSNGVILTSDTSGTLALQSNGNTIASVGASGMTINSYVAGASVITSGTVQASTSGTSIDFTGIPSWVKRITVMFNNVSSTGVSAMIVQIGGSSIETTSYASSASYTGAVSGSNPTTIGFMVNPSGQNVENFYGTLVLNLIDSSANTWVGSVAGTINQNGTWYGIDGGGAKSITGSLQKVRITTVAGTPTFDAGSINILYE